MFVCFVRYRLTEEAEWLVSELDIEVEQEEDGSVTLQDLRRITRLISQRSSAAFIVSRLILLYQILCSFI